MPSSTLESVLAHLAGVTIPEALASSTIPPTPPFPDQVVNTSNLKASQSVSDLQLMHHWTHAGYLTVTRTGTAGYMWQVAAVHLAFDHDVLLHQILAISAFHLAYLRSSGPSRNKCSALASRHQSQAAQQLRAALSDLGPGNCEPLFAASSLLVIGTFAAMAVRPGDTEQQASPRLNDMIDLFIMMKGMSTVLYTWDHVIQAGVFAPMFSSCDKTGGTTPFLDEARARLEQLRQLLTGGETDRIVGILVDHEVSKLIKAIDFAANSTLLPEARATTTWPTSIADDFLALLRKRHPAALTLLLYYCAFVHYASRTSWYMTGWGPSVAFDVMEELPSPWKHATAWPISILQSTDLDAI